jgi:hypothetical protein
MVNLWPLDDSLLLLICVQSFVHLNTRLNFGCYCIKYQHSHKYHIIVYAKSCKVNLDGYRVL